MYFIAKQCALCSNLQANQKPPPSDSSDNDARAFYINSVKRRSVSSAQFTHNNTHH